MHKLSLLASGAIALLCIGLGCGNPLNISVPVYTLVRGEFVNSVTVSGELEAVRSRVITAPLLKIRGAYPKIALIVDDGQKVEKGDQLIQFDRSVVEQAITSARNELDIAMAELSKEKVSNKSEIEDLESDLQVAEINYKLSKLELEKAEFDAEIDRKNKELALEKSAISLEQSRAEIENRKMVQSMEFNKLELKVKQARTKLEDAEESLASLTILAPTPGIAIVRDSYMTREKYKNDDQVWPGWPLIGLPDMSELRAKVEVSEIDISRIDTGQVATIRLDAYPDTVFSGRITTISSLARNKDRDSKVKVFDTTILLNNVDDKMLPGMSVNCDIIIEQIPDTIFIPLEALFLDEGRSVVYVKKGGGFNKREIITGAVSDNHAVVAEGLEEDESVAMIDPTVDLGTEEEENGEGQ